MKTHDTRSMHSHGSALKRFAGDRSGNSSIQNALLFAGIGMALAVLAAPMLQNASQYYAQNRALGIDRVLTGSVDKPDRYVVRRSVLNESPERICADGRSDC